MKPQYPKFLETIVMTEEIKSLKETIQNFCPGKESLWKPYKRSLGKISQIEKMKRSERKSETTRMDKRSTIKSSTPRQSYGRELIKSQNAQVDGWVLVSFPVAMMKHSWDKSSSNEEGLPLAYCSTYSPWPRGNQKRGT